MTDWLLRTLVLWWLDWIIARAADVMVARLAERLSVAAPVMDARAAGRGGSVTPPRRLSRANRQ